MDTSWKLRHPVGPDAVPFLEWRASQSDEDWIDWNAADDETWYKAVEHDFGLNADYQWRHVNSRERQSNNSDHSVGSLQTEIKFFLLLMIIWAGFFYRFNIDN